MQMSRRTFGRAAAFAAGIFLAAPAGLTLAAEPE